MRSGPGTDSAGVRSTKNSRRASFMPCFCRYASRNWSESLYTKPPRNRSARALGSCLEEPKTSRKRLPPPWTTSSTGLRPRRRQALRPHPRSADAARSANSGIRKKAQPLRRAHPPSPPARRGRDLLETVTLGLQPRFKFDSPAGTGRTQHRIEHRPVRPAGDADAHLRAPPRSLVVLRQPSAHVRRPRAHDVVVPRVVIRRWPKTS